MSEHGHYNITDIHYRDMYGNLLWQEKMMFNRLFALDQDIFQDGVHYVVKRVAVADNVQHVNLWTVETSSKPEGDKA